MRRASAALVAVAASVTLVACGGGAQQQDGPGGEQVSGPVLIDGSSTVEPLSSAAAELYQGENPEVNVTVGTSGTGGGFQKFCNGETDISNASRPISDTERQQCEANGIAFQELQVANDALTVVVNPANTWANCLSVEQLRAMWAPDSQVKNWNQVDPSFPAEPLQLFGAGADSGTFDYFTDEIVGEEGASRTDYSPSENDNVTVQGVTGSPGALGYFGFSYFEENQQQLKALQVDGGNGCVAPSAQTVQDASYTPLGRPLFIYASDAGLAKPQVVSFLEFYLQRNDEIVQAAQFVPMTDQQKQDSTAKLDQLRQQAGG
ncbi:MULTISPECIES: PstS family phosphate ABC transporter substrate-binding protein [Pseudonocardia]|uniref:Phosphate-binding protein n=3 Tax=Pseudonocardia TaxID=1847 RepID=A0A1I5FTW4_PSUAM|nr:MULTISPECIES: PstS family phosphate ABC transporter substrate-binding protein [Pseudonocardia]OSY36614.1 Phosphate-binding protein PstS precursor [Pseudonocardia autotrophica]TDN65444.1 phosphate ABC transporter substrate-binding protein (PhoT family) [Pseudonocardia autotrophica]SFO26641.1 phosphate ABC transporter substrate-binding protein, PhoT family [Pseudonocardia ammonioxydans]